MDSIVWHVASLVFSGLATAIAVLIMHIVGTVERSQMALQSEVTKIGKSVARMEGVLTRNEGRTT